MRFSLPPALLPRILFAAIASAVPLASFLAFSVQPLVGKLLLPVQGGAAATWLGTMLYFQIALLLGYAWAAWLLARRPLVQVGATAGLSLVAIVGTTLDWVPQSQWTGIGGILGALTLATLPAMVLLFSTAPLMHGWLRGRGQSVPYYLYAVSSAGSLFAVLLYPFTIERRLGLGEQMFYWHGLLCVVAALAGVAGWCILRGESAGPAPREAEETISARQVFTWLGLSAMTCVGMLGATHHLAAEIGSTPLAWVGPFGAFLLSYLVIFSGIWQPYFTLVSLGWLAVSLTGFMLTKGVSNATVDGPAVFWLMSLTAAGSFFANGVLYESRPARRFVSYYLILAAGGILGGLFASVGAPVVFLRPSEFLVVSVLLLVLGLLRLLARREVLPTLIATLIVLAPVLGLTWKQTSEAAASATMIRRFRNIYGYSMLEFRKTADYSAVILSSETTTHGSQMVRDADARKHPTLYYSESSGVGRMIEEAQKSHPSVTIGAIGLGTGTLAAYARPGDRIDFWDIDPKVIRFARDFFTYVPDSRGDIHIVQADGRKGLLASSIDYDLLVVDAFSGDAIPPHLLTREALEVYFQRLARHEGILVIHASNRYNTIFPIIGATARSLGWMAVNVVTTIAQTTPTRDWDADGRPTQYILVCRPTQLQGILEALPFDEDDGRVKRTINVYDPAPPGTAVIWTDDRHAIIDSLNLKGYLLGK